MVDSRLPSRQTLNLWLGIALTLLLALGGLMASMLARFMPAPLAEILAPILLGAGAAIIAGYAVHRYLARMQDSLEARTTSLDAALRQASTAHEETQRMVAYLGHDLRSPLGTILHYVHLLASSSGQLSRHYQEVIERSVTHQLELIDELMEYARGDLEHLNLSPAPTYLHAFLEELAHQGELLAEQRGNRFKMSIGENLPAVTVIDPKRLKQVLLNLLSNASKFTESGSIRMRIEVEDIPAPLLRFSVSDTGMGISGDDLNEIFKPYERRTQTQPGLGLGLAIADALVNKMQGKLEVESAEGMGARFWFQLPLQTAREQDVLLPLHAFAVPEPFGSGKRILVVEQQQASRDYLTEVLSLADFDVVGIATPEEAAPFLEAGHFSAVIAVQDEAAQAGWQMLQMLDERLGNSSPPLVLCSALPSRKPNWLMAPLMPVATLLKPVTPEKLLETMRNLFEDDAEMALPGHPSPQNQIPEEMYASLREMIALGNVSDILEWALQVERDYPDHAYLTLALRNAALRIDFKALALLASKQS